MDRIDGAWRMVRGDALFLVGRLHLPGDYRTSSATTPELQWEWPRSIAEREGQMMLPARSLELDWIQGELSSRCAGRCVYCPVHRFRGRRHESVMADETFAALEPSLPVARLVFLQGWGEPLMDPQLWSRVERVRKAGPDVGFTTNGTLLESF